MERAIDERKNVLWDLLPRRHPVRQLTLQGQSCEPPLPRREPWLGYIALLLFDGQTSLVGIYLFNLGAADRPNVILTASTRFCTFIPIRSQLGRILYSPAFFFLLPQLAHLPCLPPLLCALTSFFCVSCADHSIPKRRLCCCYSLLHKNRIC